MKRAKRNDSKLSTLRRTAIQRFKEENIASSWPKTEENILRLMYELEVHQIELKLQNEQLQWSRDEVKQETERYKDFYDFAPVGYFTLSSDGVILAANLAGASLLGLERSRLVGRNFQRLIAPESTPAFKQLLERVFMSQEKEVADLALPKAKEQQFFVRIEAKVSQTAQECRAALIDVTEARRAVEALRQSEERLAGLQRQLQGLTVELAKKRSA